MRRRLPIGRPALIVLALLVALDLAIVAASAAGLRINTTSSMPLGVYRVVVRGTAPIARGALVAVCPSAEALAVALPRRYLKPGGCNGDVEPLLKEVAGVPSDTVDVSASGVTINGHRLPNSAWLARDCQGLPLPHIASGRFVLPSGMIWLYAPAPRSWDSRYYGAVPAEDVVGIATPVLIVGRGEACS